MARALQLAARGLNTATPNPRVGCVIVRDGLVIGEGWHRRTGEPHAEAIALSAAGEKARGATAYVTLEPCSHFGRTPPCADALIDAGVVRVVAAMSDPNPLVSGRGMERLRASGVITELGLLEDEAQELNIGFVSRMSRGRPWLRLKAAASLDGKTALDNGASQWITGPAARRDGHAWRARACAVLTGIGTVREDDPRLNVRDVACERQPLKILIDARLEVSPQARLLEDGHCLIVTASDDPAKCAQLRDRGAELVVLPNASGKVDLPSLMRELGDRGLNEVHAEAGLKLNGSLLREGCVDEILLYFAPMLIGDQAQGLFKLPALSSLADARNLDIRDVRMIGDDLRIIARAKDR
jgi:diaminohydroxyphosphoribosylaminopyrimidine deaminase/5-amino-6-(5-phosphoribosylamino)uracil reductase